MYKGFVIYKQLCPIPTRAPSRADVCRLLAEWYDTKPNVKLGGFQSQLEASYVFGHNEELWYNETACQ